jgi:glutamyl-tRNA synthetase
MLRYALDVTTTRFAPSPTGDLHLGGAWTALASWALARSTPGGKTVLRIEDIDTPRVVAGASERILEDLRWLGLDWDTGPVWQSSRLHVYEEALQRLERAGYTYRCDCSRKDIARVASAPHEGEEGQETIYPGTCRDAPRDRIMKRPPCVRLRVDEEATVRFFDRVRGEREEVVAKAAGDFVLRRADGVYSYQFVVALDDAAMGITDVVRADDLLGSTARQLYVMKLLGAQAFPRYAHIPLVVGPGGERLAKRTRGATVRDVAKAGVPAHELIGTLARGLGLVLPSLEGPLSPQQVAASLQPPSAWRTEPWPLV